MKLLVAGAGGMVGKAVATCCAALGDDVLALDRQALDITNDQQVRQRLERERPQTVINCAAWTDVDGCEVDSERAQKVNARGPEILALACRNVDALLITISTDYVFDGEKDGFYTQRDQPNPQSVYAVSKLDGERRAQISWARTVVVRSGLIFGVGGRNFLSSVIGRARRGATLTAIADAFGTPTYAKDLARRLRYLAELDLPGVYHIVNRGEGTSYQEFALTALAAAQCDATRVTPISMDDLNRPASRPRNARLRCLLSEAIGLVPLPFWQDALKDFVAELDAQGSQ